MGVNCDSGKQDRNFSVRRLRRMSILRDHERGPLQRRRHRRTLDELIASGNTLRQRPTNVVSQILVFRICKDFDDRLQVL